MSRAVCIIIYVINALNAFSQKKRKWPSLLMLLLMFLMFSFVTTPTYQHKGYFRGDNEIYEKQYNQLKDASLVEAFSGKYSVDSKTVGYTFVTWAYSRAGIPFYGFMASIFIVCSLLVHSIFKEITKNSSFFLMLYFGYYFLYDIQQIRNFIGVSIVLFAIKKLRQGKKILFCIIVLVAATFHTTMLAFLVFILADTKSVWKYKRTFIKAVGIVMAALICANFSGLNIVKIAAASFYTSGYLADSFNPIRPLIEVCMFLCFAKIVGRIYNENNNNNLIALIYRLNVVSLAFLPLIMISMTMDRLLRPVLLLNYALFSEYRSSIHHRFSTVYLDTNLANMFEIMVMVSLMTYFFSKSLFVWIFDSNVFFQWLGE